jgi:hypothetical protein
LEVRVLTYFTGQVVFSHFLDNQGLVLFVHVLQVLAALRDRTSSSLSLYAYLLVLSTLPIMVLHLFVAPSQLLDFAVFLSLFPPLKGQIVTLLLTDICLFGMQLLLAVVCMGECRVVEGFMAQEAPGSSDFMD